MFTYRSNRKAAEALIAELGGTIDGGAGAAGIPASDNRDATTQQGGDGTTIGPSGAETTKTSPGGPIGETNPRSTINGGAGAAGIPSISQEDAKTLKRGADATVGADGDIGREAALTSNGEMALTNSRASAVRLDLSDEQAVAALVEVIASSGGLHTVVYASGPYVPMEYVSKVTPERFREQCEGDIQAFYNLLHAVLPHLRSAAGSLVAVTTCANRRFPKRDALSSAPKGAVEALVRAVSREEGRYGVRANCVGPGLMADGMAEVLMESGELSEQAQQVALANIALGRFGAAGDIAEAVCFLASDRARYITGQFLDVDGGYSV